MFTNPDYFLAMFKSRFFSPVLDFTIEKQEARITKSQITLTLTLFKKQFYCEKGNLLLATTKNSNFCKLKYDKITLKFNS